MVFSMWVVDLAKALDRRSGSESAHLPPVLLKRDSSGCVGSMQNRRGRFALGLIYS